MSLEFKFIVDFCNYFLTIEFLFRQNDLTRFYFRNVDYIRNNFKQVVPIADNTAGKCFFLFGIKIRIGQ